MSRLPQGYTELEWIESDGTQYIRTGIYPTENTTVHAEIQITKFPSGIFSLFGVQGSSANFSIKARSTNDYIYRIAKSAAIQITTGVSFLERYVYHLSNKEARVGDYSVSVTTGSFESENEMTIIGIQSDSGHIEKGSARIFYFDIYNGEKIERRYIPCINHSGSVGLYDTVASLFYGNDGTGDFIAGPEAQTPPDPPAELSYIAINNRVQLRWSVVQDAERYNVYRDGILLNEVVDLVYEDEVTGKLSHLYEVTAINDAGESVRKMVRTIGVSNVEISHKIINSGEPLQIRFTIFGSFFEFQFPFQNNSLTDKKIIFTSKEE